MQGPCVIVNIWSTALGTGKIKLRYYCLGVIGIASI